MYQNYIFDLYGTLVDIHTDEDRPRVWEALALFYGYQGARYAPEELRDAYHALVGAEEEALRPQGGWPEIRLEKVFQRLFEARGVRPGEDLVRYAGQLFRAVSTDYLRLYNGVPAMLDALRRRGKGVYLLSNAQRIFTQYELKLLGLEAYFDGILLSSDAGVKKPDRRFFQRLLDTCRLEPGESIMIGNDPQADIAGARAAGLDTCYLRSNLSPEHAAGVDATFTLPEPDMDRLCRMLGITG